MSLPARRDPNRLSAALSSGVLAALLALAMLGAIGSLSGCGLKGALYLPPQKKAKVPATPSNPTSEPESAPAPSGEAAPGPDSAKPAGSS